MLKVAFIGHRNIEEPEKLKEKLEKIIDDLIENEKADTFLFGSKSQFDDLCYQIVTQLKEKYKYIQRIYVRSLYEHLAQFYKDYLFTLYEDTFYPKQVQGAGILSYVKRNQIMIDTCDILIVYCNENYKPKGRKRSGTKIAVEYAAKKHKRILNVYI